MADQGCVWLIGYR